MITATATILSKYSAGASIKIITAVASIRMAITIIETDMRWTTTFTNADDALILVPGEPYKRFIEEIPADAPLDQMLILVDNNPVNVVSWIDQVMTFEAKPQNFQLRIQYPNI